MGWSDQNIIAQTVVIEGTGDGLYVYNGAPALGNPPETWIVPFHVGTVTDPFGNLLPFSGGVCTRVAGGAVGQFINGSLFLYDSSLSLHAVYGINVSIGSGGAKVLSGPAGNEPLIVQGGLYVSLVSNKNPTTSDLVEFDGAVALGAQGSAPASVASFAQLYADQFSQLHTDRAFQTDVNVETLNLGSSPGAGGSGAKLWSSGGHQQAQSGQTGIGGDALNYDVERLTLTAAGQTVSSTIGVTVTGLTKTLGVGTYHVRGAITYEGSQNGGTPTIGFAEPSLSAGWYTSQYLVATNNASATSPLTAFNNTGFDPISTSHAGPTLVLNQFVTFSFDAIVTVSTAGALTMQAKTSNGADTYVIQAGGYMEIMPVVAS